MRTFEVRGRMMSLSLSAPVELLDALISSKKTQITFQPPRRFVIGSVVGLYADQRKKIIDKPLRELTEIGCTEMVRMSDIGKKNYPPVTSNWYYAHFLGRVEIQDVLHIVPNDAGLGNSWATAEGFSDMQSASEWFSARYNSAWNTRTCTIVRWKYIERYFEPLPEIEFRQQSVQYSTEI